MPVSGSIEPPHQLAPPPQPGSWMVPPTSLEETIGGVKIGPALKWLTIASASALISGVKSMITSRMSPWYSNAGGLVGKGWVAEARSPGTSDGGTGRSSIGQIGSP